VIFPVFIIISTFLSKVLTVYCLQCASMLVFNQPKSFGQFHHKYRNKNKAQAQQIQFPWKRYHPNQHTEEELKLIRKIHRRTCVVGAFPDGNSALMLICACLRHVAGTQ